MSIKSLLSSLPDDTEVIVVNKDKEVFIIQELNITYRIQDEKCLVELVIDDFQPNCTI